MNQNAIYFINSFGRLNIFTVAIIYLNFIDKVRLNFAVRKGSQCKEYPCLVFKDDFTSLNFDVWEHFMSAAQTGNREFQYYTNNRTNSYIKNDCLYLRPTLTNNTFDDEFLFSGTLDLWGTSPFTQCTSMQNEGCVRKGSKDSIINPIQSAGVRTSKSFSIRYGKINIRAKLPKGDWLWPALWLLPKYDVYGNWPASGEIDIMESRGNENYHKYEPSQKSIGNNNAMQSLHWGPYFEENRHELTKATIKKKEGSYADDFHVYSVTLSPEGIYFFIDDVLTLNITVDSGGFWKLGKFSENIHNPWSSGTKMAPFDQEFYLIMNLAVGGNNGYFHDNFKPQAPWDNDESDHGKLMKQFWDNRDSWLPTWKGEETALKIDYVEVWKLRKDP